MKIESFSNWNEKLSRKEINFLTKFNKYKEILQAFDTKQLNTLKSSLILQMEKYNQRNNVLERSKKYISSITKRIIKKIDKIIKDKENLQDLEELEKEFPSIENIKELEKLVKQRLIKYEDVQKWIKKWWHSVRIHYQNWKTDKVNIHELKKFFENIQIAQKYSIRSAQEWIKKSKDNKKINYQAISNYAQNQLLENKEKSPNLTKLIAQAQYFMGAKETWNDPLSRKLQARMKNFGLDIRNNPSHNWCAAFVWDCLIRAWYFKDINDLKKHLPKPYPDVASNYIGIWYFKAHMWIYTWGEIMINWNSHNMVRYSKVRWNKLVWWIMPSDLWNPNKVHFYQKEKTKPPVGALLIFERVKWSLPKQIALKAWFNKYV